ncbi:MAG: 2'-5' RNA ligase family protein [Myxococcales bacterium]|nr:2'-5' RNA ligase family protein [Myxococcales bacterium]
MTTTRTQLTLFVDDRDAAALEEVRAEFNPAQHRLIRSHVTLCREDELLELPRIRGNLAAALPSLALTFGPPRRFADGAGVLLPAIGDPAPFEQLRAAVLAGVTAAPRALAAHITLMHPRNATCTAAVFAQIAARRLPDRLRFGAISLIAQVDGGPWTVLDEFPLRS